MRDSLYTTAKVNRVETMPRLCAKTMMHIGPGIIDFRPLWERFFLTRLTFVWVKLFFTYIHISWSLVRQSKAPRVKQHTRVRHKQHLRKLARGPMSHCVSVQCSAPHHALKWPKILTVSPPTPNNFDIRKHYFLCEFHANFTHGKYP